MSGNLLSGETVDRTELEVRQSQQLEFFLMTLQTIHDSNYNPEAAFLLIEQNLDLLDNGIVEVATNWLSSNLANADQNSQMFILSSVAQFIDYLPEFSSDKKIINKIELLITYLLMSVKRLTNTEYHIALAGAHRDLGFNYSERICGNRAENLDESIKHYLSALKILRKLDLFGQWAATQNNLAHVYVKRIRGDKSNNQEKSIKCYLSALEFFQKQDSPHQWASIQHNLGFVYGKRIKGNPKENVEKSVTYYQSALEVYTAESFPFEWANIQIQLAQLSISQLRNYRIAKEYLQAAYEQLSTNNGNMFLLAQTMFELGRCSHQTGVLGQARIYFKDSIRLYQRLEQPTLVATITSELGNLELQMGQIDDARIHLQTALEFFQNTGNADRIKSIQALQQYLPEFNKEQVA
jgi:tetratricopeptide (TPR) repeat protein